MKRIVVDQQKSFKSLKFDELNPRMKRDEDGNLLEEQDKDKAGVPLYDISCIARPIEGKAEVIKVKVPLPQVPKFEEDDKLVFANLTAYSYGYKVGNGADAMLTFSADKVGKIQERQ